MSFTDVLDQQNTSSSGGGAEFKEIRESQFNLESKAYIKFFPDTVKQVFEVWLRPSDNLPDNASEDLQYIFKVLRINSDKTRDVTTLAKVYGAPDKWSVNSKDKKYVDNGNYKGGIMEFKYSEHKGPNGKKFRIYKYLQNPDLKPFFDGFAYAGKPHKMEDYPKTPQLKYYIACAIENDQWSVQNKSYRWISITNSIFQQLAKYFKEGHDISKVWFSLEKEGSGLDTKYTLTPCTPEKSVTFDQTSTDDSFKMPDIEKASQVSGAYYVNKYLKTYLEGVDNIMKTNFAVTIAAEAEASKPEQDAAEEQPMAAAASESVPSEISSAFEKPPGGMLSDDDIPF